MISKIAGKITKHLVSKYSITKEDEEVYFYAFFIVTSSILFVFISCVFGFVFDCFVESIVFSVFFQLLRKCSGGYHAKTESLCLFLTILCSLCSILSIKIIIIFKLNNIMLIVTMGFAFIIYFMVPVETERRHLNTNERLFFRKSSRYILMILFCISIVTFHLQFNVLFVPCIVCIIFEGILIIAGKISTSD